MYCKCAHCNVLQLLSKFLYVFAKNLLKSIVCFDYVCGSNANFQIGKDKSVVLWSIQDHISALGDSSKIESSPGASASKLSSKTGNEKDSPKVDPRGVFHGHDSTVEDVQFCPSR
jgi:hypothetical protein